MKLFKKGKIMMSILAISLLFSANTTPLYALEYHKFSNIDIDMPAVISIDECSGNVLYAQNENSQRPIASLTKSMTLLLILDSINKGELSLSDIIEVDEDPESWGSSFYLEKGDKYTVQEFMQMIMIISANDACVVMAKKISGSVDSFVSLMNSRAKELGMSNTKFFNPNGLPLIEGEESNPGNLSTAKDLAILVRYIMNSYGEEVIPLVSQQKMDISGSKDARYNSNKLLFRNKDFEGYVVDGFKTGFTDDAGFCLITTSEHDNNTPKHTEDDYRVVSVSLGGSTSEHRFKEHTKLLDYVQTTYKNTKISSSGEAVFTLNEYNSDKYKMNLSPQDDMYALINKKNTLKLEQEFIINKDISYPVDKGEVLGFMRLYDKKEPNISYSVKLVTLNSTEDVSLFDRIFKGIK